MTNHADMRPWNIEFRISVLRKEVGLEIEVNPTGSTNATCPVCVKLRPRK